MKRYILESLGTVALFAMSTVTSGQNPNSATIPSTSNTYPPTAKKSHTEKNIHGGKLVDDYRWLRDKQNAEVAKYLEAENAYADSIMKPTEALQKQLYDEMVGHIKETDVNVPYREGGYFYYSRWEKGKQYPIYARKKGGLDAAEQITVDVNELAKGEKFMALGAYHPSDDGNFLAYSTDNTGFRQYRMHVRDLRSGKDLVDTAQRVGSIAWTSDNRTLFYSVEEDKTTRHYRIYRHQLGTDPSHDQLVYEDPDERFNVAVGRSRSRKFLFLESASHTTTEVRYLAADAPGGEWKIVAPRQQDIEYYVDHRGDQFLIRTNDKGRTFRLVSAPVTDPGKNNWKEIIPVRADVMLSDVEPFQDFYVLAERENGLPQLTVVKDSGEKRRIEFQDPVYTAAPGNNHEFTTKFFRYNYQSLVTPNSVFDYDTESKTSTLLKQTEVPGGFDATQYKSERVWATGKDGTRIPISVVYRKELKKPDGSNPLYVSGYGSYGFVLPITFSSNRLSLLDRGVVTAYVHIRGGGDLGKPWHDQGRMMKKMNTFNDFIACTEYLTANNYGARDKIAIEGGSAGGLLMGAVTNLRPDLFRVVVAHVPFVDVMNTMLDASLPLTVPEYEEWGNPHEKPAYDYMLQYSPYDNLKKTAYPAMLVKTSFNDSQVMYWEPAKYVARLRTLKTDNHPLILKTNMAAGHSGASGRYDHLKEIALDYAFMLTQLGVER